MSFMNKLVSAMGQLFTTTEPVLLEEKQRRTVRQILWREFRYCQDKEYGQQVTALIESAPGEGDLIPQERPLASEVEQALYMACQWQPQAQSVWAEPLNLLQQKQYAPDPPAQLIANLQSDNWIARFVARHTLHALGGESVSRLMRLAEHKESALRQTARWLLRSIAADTTAHFAAHYSRLLCPRCLVHYYANEIDLPDESSLVFYGCRTCGQSKEFLEWTGQVITVLDKTMTEPYVIDYNTIRGNWFLLRQLFDSDSIEIINASDEDVERFAVQVGNDTDPFRQPHYQNMACTIEPACHLSDNTRRILNKMLGEVRHL